MIARRELLIGFVLASILMILCNGCATVDRDGWQDYPTHEPLPAVVVASTAAEVRSHCPLETAFVFGCAVRDTEHRVCVIYVDAKPLMGTMEHEFRHCAGYSHHG